MNNREDKWNMRLVMNKEEFIFKEKQGKELDLFEQFITNYSKSQLAEMLCESLDNWNKLKEWLYTTLDINCCELIEDKMQELESGDSYEK